MTEYERITCFLIPPFKSFFLQSLVPQGKAGLIPVQHLYLVTIFIAEDEHLTTKHILLKLLFDNGTQTVNRFTKINRLTM